MLSIAADGLAWLEDRLAKNLFLAIESVEFGLSNTHTFPEPSVDTFILSVLSEDIRFEYIGSDNIMRLIVSVDAAGFTIGNMVLYVRTGKAAHEVLPLFYGNLAREYTLNNKTTFVFEVEAPNLAVAIDYNRVIDHKKLLTTPFKFASNAQESIWVSWAKSINILAHNMVTRPRIALGQVREINTMTAAIKQNTAKDLGVPFVNLLTDKDIDRLLRYISMYWPLQSTKHFNKFLAYVLALRLDILQLWATADASLNFYERFEHLPLGTTVLDDGEWFPTSHVEIQYDALAGLDAAGKKNIVNIFYHLAPIHLVIERIVETLWNDPTKSAMTASFALRGLEEHCSIYAIAENPNDTVVLSRPAPGPMRNWLYQP